jgi:hypothetical protein
LGTSDFVWIPVAGCDESYNESSSYVKEEAVIDLLSNNKLLTKESTPRNLLGRGYFRKEAEGVWRSVRRPPCISVMQFELSTSKL